MNTDRETLTYLARHLHTLQAVTLHELRNQISVVSLCLGADSTDTDLALDVLDSQLDQTITQLNTARNLLHQIKENH